MNGHYPSGFTSSTFTITENEFPSDAIVPFSNAKVVKSLTNLFEISSSVEEWNRLFWENPWVVFWWFG